jgi:hypothetical protein
VIVAARLDVCSVCGEDIIELQPGEWSHLKRSRSGRPWSHRPRPVPTGDDVATDS